MRQKKTQRQKAAKKTEKDTAEYRCPLCELVKMFEHSGCECLEVFKQTRIEFLKAIRTLINKRVEALEKGGPKRGRGGRVRKIEVED
jgi:hypothetical protein